MMTYYQGKRTNHEMRLTYFDNAHNHEKDGTNN